MGKEYRKTVLFGLHKKSVDHFLKKLHDLQEKELQELRSQLKSASHQNGQLGDKLNDLRSRQRQGRTKDLFEQVLQKVEESEMKPTTDAPFVKPMLKIVRTSNKDEIIQASVEGSLTLLPDTEASDLTDAIQEELVVEEVPEVEEVTVIKEIQVSSSNGFWGDADKYLDEEIIGIAKSAITMDRAKPTTLQPQQQAKPMPVTSAPINETYVEEIAVGLQIEVEQQPLLNNNIEEKSDNVEIEKIKMNYIVGKMAGENLLDQQGRLIVAKEAMITEEVMRRAQREGKLAELIVHMTIPGLGE